MNEHFRMAEIIGLCMESKSNEVTVSKEELMWLVGELDIKLKISKFQEDMLDSLYKKIGEFRVVVEKDKERLNRIMSDGALNEAPLWVGELCGVERMEEEFENIFGKQNPNDKLE